MLTDAHGSALIVEDDHVVRTTISEALRGAGWIATPAATLREGLELLGTLKFDAVIVDMMLPDGHGTALAVAASTAANRPPVVFLTAYSEGEMVKSAADAGAIAYLIKPIDPKRLLSALQIATARALEARVQAERTAQLAVALNQSREVSVAIGLLMERHRLSHDEAFTMLRTASRNQRTKVADLAKGLVESADGLSLSGLREKPVFVSPVTRKPADP